MPRQWKVLIILTAALSVVSLGTGVGLFLWNLDQRRSRVEQLDTRDQQLCRAILRIQQHVGVKRYRCSKLPPLLPH